MSVNPVTGLANCKHRKDQHRWHDELGYSLYHYEMNTFKLADSTLLPELKLVSWYDTETKMPLDVGSMSGIRATLKSRALGFVKRRLSGERVVAVALPNWPFARDELSAARAEAAGARTREAAAVASEGEGDP